jgi:DNA repair exonuclease SbcCD ATPase subunit
MKIVRLEAENVKKLKAVTITPDGAIVQITGPNGSGKTSVLDAIYMALAGKRAIDSEPVRSGTESARILLDLGEVIVRRTFRADDGTTKLEVMTVDGARFPSPQKMLDSLLGTLTFDPLAFSRADAKGQLETLKALVPLEIDLEQLDFENRRDFDVRTGVSRTIRELEAQVKGLHLVDVADPPDVAALLNQLEKAVEHNREVDIEARRRSDYHASIAHKDIRLAKLREEVRELETDLGLMRDEVAMWGPEETVVDVRELREQIDAATDVIRTYEAAQRVVRERKELLAKLDSAHIEAEDLTAKIEARTATRTAAIAAAKMPVEGLAFGDGEVRYNGHPFSQASGAEQLRVSVAIAMAGSPKLRVLRVKDGSLLDSKSLAILTEMAELRDFQVWIEQVSESGTVGIVMEDGSIVPARA